MPCEAELPKPISLGLPSVLFSRFSHSSSGRRLSVFSSVDSRDGTTLFVTRDAILLYNVEEGRNDCCSKYFWARLAAVGGLDVPWWNSAGKAATLGTPGKGEREAQRTLLLPWSLLGCPWAVCFSSLHLLSRHLSQPRRSQAAGWLQGQLRAQGSCRTQQGESTEHALGLLQSRKDLHPLLQRQVAAQEAVSKDLPSKSEDAERRISVLLVNKGTWGDSWHLEVFKNPSLFVLF